MNEYAWQSCCYRSHLSPDRYVDYHMLPLQDGTGRAVCSILAVEHWEGVAVETAFFYDVTAHASALRELVQRMAREEIPLHRLQAVIEAELRQCCSPLL